MAIFSRTEVKLKQKEIIEIENFIGLKFPIEYKSHLLQYNGGKCSPCQFAFTEKGKITTSSIDWFLAIYDGEYDNLRDYINTYKIEQKRLPSNLVPIAHDSGGNLVCISCGSKDYGQIFFWDHEREVDYSRFSDDNYSNLYFVAKNFDEFIDNLK